MGRHRAEAEGKFRLLFVCTGNICRSPFAEIITRHLIIGRLGGRAAASAFAVSSAGVRAVVGSGMHPDSRAELAPWSLDGAEAGRFKARQLRSAMVLESDLVLGATPRHRSAVVERAPAALPITFSLREFARLSEAVDPDELPTGPIERARALVELARAQRGLVAPPEDGDEIPDPISGPQSAHHSSALLILDAAQRVADVMVPSAPATRPLRAAQ
jgi:protein-tyrosine phosphatase